MDQGLCRDPSETRPRWTASSTGEFSTKSGYALLESLNPLCRESGGESSNQRHVETFWKKIWKAPVPPKIRLTVWRMFHNSLPDFLNLSKRGCQVDNSCWFCGFNDESILHLCRDCWWGKEIGKRIDIDAEFFEMKGGSTADWIFHCVSRMRGRRLLALLCFIWAVWTSRNNWVHDDKRWGIEEVVAKIETILRQSDSRWTSYMSDSLLMSGENVNSFDRMCFFCDGSWLNANEVAGWAVVVWHNSGVDRILAEWNGSDRSALDTEGWALWMGMLEAAKAQQQRALFLSDSVTAIWAIFSGGVGVLSQSPWLKDCLDLLEKFPLWEFGHIPRDQNSIADDYCRKARKERWSWSRKDAVPWRKTAAVD